MKIEAIAVDIDRFNIKTYKNVYSKFYIDDLVFTRENVEKT